MPSSLVRRIAKSGDLTTGNYRSHRREARQSRLTLLLSCPLIYQDCPLDLGRRNQAFGCLHGWKIALPANGQKIARTVRAEPYRRGHGGDVERCYRESIGHKYCRLDCDARQKAGLGYVGRSGPSLQSAWLHFAGNEGVAVWTLQASQTEKVRPLHIIPTV